MKKIKRYVLRLFANTFFQPLFEILHYISLKGMNYGSANSPKYSGELALLKMLRNELPNNPIIFDVGANNGQYLGFLLKLLETKNPIIHSFEPDPVSFNKLYKKYGANKNIYLNNFALGEKEMDTKLYISSDGGVDASLINVKNKNSKNIEIQLKTLDQYCINNNINKIHFLKIDVEGYEINVLQGGLKLITNNSIERIQLEHGSINSIIAGASLYKLSKLLPKHNLFHIKQNGIYKLIYKPRNEIFYNSNYYFKLKSE